MNIVIQSLTTDGIKLVQTNLTDIDTMKLFIAKDIANPEDIEITLHGTGESTAAYLLDKEKISALDKNAYYGYKLTSQISIPAATYTLSIDSINIETNFQITDSTSQLDDEHEPIYIIGRQINPITQQIVAQDANSQQFVFYIKRKYDGISFLDDSKKIWVDFIPIDGKRTAENGSLEEMGEIPFLSDQITDIKALEKAPNGKSGEWLALKWNLPYDATRLAGTVKFDLSVIDESDQTRAYTWQTFPSSFAVSANLGFRTSIVNVAAADNILQTLSEEIDGVKEDVTNLEALVGLQSDENPNNDVEVVFDGGGAPVEGGN